MLIKRTPWFVQDDEGYDFVHDFPKKGQVFLCTTGLYLTFDVPYDAKYVRFYLYDRPSKNTVRCELMVFRNEVYLNVVQSNYGDACVDIAACLSHEVARKLTDKQDFYYLECEYAY